MTAINRILIVDDEDNVRRMLSTDESPNDFGKNH